MLAGPIVDALGYPWLFWIPMVVVTLAALSAYRFVPESPVRHAGPINWLAAGLLSAWLVLLLLALSRASESGWSSTGVIGLLLAAAVVLAAWIAAELRSANPLIDIVAGIVSGRIEPRFSSKAQLATASTLSVLAFTALAFAHDERWQVAVAAALFGAGIGLALTSLTNLIVTSVPASQTGVASGMNANFRTIGGAIGAAVMGSIVTGNLQPTGLPYEAGYTDGFLLLSAISIASVAAAAAVPSARRAARTGAEDETRHSHAGDVRFTSSGLPAG